MNLIDDVPRPYRKTDYRIRFTNREAAKGWRDLVATARNSAATAWDFLTVSPTERGTTCYPLSQDLEHVIIHGKAYVRWQYKPTNGGRIWYAVLPADKGDKLAGIVAVERVTTGHPNETLKNHR